MSEFTYKVPLEVTMTMEDAIQFIQSDPEDFIHFVAGLHRGVIHDYLTARGDDLGGFILSGGLAQSENE